MKTYNTIASMLVEAAQGDLETILDLIEQEEWQELIIDSDLTPYEEVHIFEDGSQITISYDYHYHINAA